MVYENEIVQTLMESFQIGNSPKAIYITGPMFSGKTTLCANIIRRILDATSLSYLSRRLVVCDSANSRGSHREIRNVCPINEKLEFVDSLPYPNQLAKLPALVIFDETHLFGVIGQKDKFIDCVIQLLDKGISVLAAGLWADCYNDYQIFGVVREYMTMASHIYQMPSFKPCYICGSTKYVVYSVNTETKASTIGDHYDNICFRCQRSRKCVNMTPSVGGTSIQKTL